MTQPSTATPVVFISHNFAVTTSIDVAAYFGKRHDDVLRKIANLDCSPKYHLRNFTEVFRETERGNGAIGKSCVYEMTKDGFIFLVMSFTGAKAAQFKEAYIAKFNELEARHALHILNTPTKALPAPEIPVILSVPREGRYFVHVDQNRRITVQDIGIDSIVPVETMRTLRQDFRTLRQALTDIAERSLVMEGQRHARVLEQPFEIKLTVKP